ncbi:uncharacterized protein LOC143595164 [Bidens hawaiensis]|uniref:uncharacterized protein LOC143595164 n=1 Tax=Bidens hawaiensis TaxID=980011 RepID=UPI00404A9700
MGITVVDSSLSGLVLAGDFIGKQLARPTDSKGTFGSVSILRLHHGDSGLCVTKVSKEEKNEDIEENVTVVTSTSAFATSTATVTDSITSQPVVVEPAKVCEPIPVDQQLELFKWILEEKRKIKPKNAEGKMKIDEEKAILKQSN